MGAPFKLRLGGAFQVGAPSAPSVRFQPYPPSEMAAFLYKISVRIQPFSLSSWFSFSERSLRIEQDRNRPIVHQLHLHRRLKPASFAYHPSIANLPDKIFVQFVPHSHRCGVIKRRPLAFASVTIQNELRNRENRTTGLGNR